MPLRHQFETEQDWLLHLRIYFAAKAMQGLLSDPQRDGSFREYAEDAYRFADAMILAREQ